MVGMGSWASDWDSKDLWAGFGTNGDGRGGQPSSDRARVDRRLLRGLAQLLFGLSWAASVAAAPPPCVHFDVNDLVAAREVTSPAFAAANPDESLVEVRLDISSLIRFGHDEQLFQYLYVISNPSRRGRIVDWEPKTELVSEIAGSLQIDGSSQRHSDLELNVQAAWPAVGAMQLQGENSDQQQTQYRYELLPPQKMVVASGTIERGSGAYFKLAPSNRTTLEGERQFVLLVRVPRTWRADLLLVRCAAYAAGSSDASERAICGSAGFLVAVYHQDDHAAKEAAGRLVNSERRLRQAEIAYRHQIVARQHPSLADKLGAVLALRDPKIPPRWLDTILAGTPTAELSFADRLPPPVRLAMQEYLTERQEFEALRGGEGMR
jgi:hypothetical protein